jgi:hypothetical protein
VQGLSTYKVVLELNSQSEERHVYHLYIMPVIPLVYATTLNLCKFSNDLSIWVKCVEKLHCLLVHCEDNPAA